MSPQKNSKSAFTLMEVLIAVAIFAGAALMLAMGYVNVLNSYAISAKSHDSDEDVKFACKQMMAEPDLQKAKDGDQFDGTGGRHVVWTTDIQPTTTADLFTVTFTCEITGGDDPKKVTQTFTLLRPTWSDPADRSKLMQDAKDRIADIQGKKT